MLLRYVLQLTGFPIGLLIGGMWAFHGEIIEIIGLESKQTAG